MTEQIYINGTLMEQASGKSASLVFQSPFFTDIDNIVSNRTNTVEFPATENNRRAIDNAHLPGSTSKFAYRKHKVIYLRDGVQIFSGYATLLQMAPSIKFCFTWGNVNAFQSLLDINLRDLQTEDDYIDWTAANISSNAMFPTNVIYEARGMHGSSYTTVGHTHPHILVSDILTRLSARSGVEFQNSGIFSNLAIPVLYRIADDVAKTSQGIQLRAGDIVKLAANQWQKKFVFELGTGDQDLKGQYLGNGVFDVSEYETVRVIVRKGSTWKTHEELASGVKTIIRGLGIIATDSDGGNTQLIASIPLTYTQSNYDTTYVASEDITLDINLNWKLNGETGRYAYLQLCPLWTPNAYEATASVSNISIDLSLVCGIEEDASVLFGGKYPLYANLPDWTAGQLLKNLMKLRGVFAVCPDSATIIFKSIDELYAQRADACDWTEKFMLDGGEPEEAVPTFGSYARKNRCKFAEDETNKSSFDADLIVDNETLDSEADLLSLDFAGTDYQIADNSETLNIRCYSVNSSADEDAEEFAEVTPRIYEVESRAAKFSNLDFAKLLKTKYYTYAQTVNRPRVIKAKVLLDALDLANLDLSVPVFSYALGHYYAISKLTTKDAYTAEVELLELGEVEAASDTPTEEQPSSQLTIARDEDGNYYATIPSLSGTDLAAMIADPNYKLCLLRYGYARRGEWKKYTDSRGSLIWTHCSRNAVYRKVAPTTKNPTGTLPPFRYHRKGLQWRIIGADILYQGKQGASSQQTKTGYYDGSTLVFDLKETIVLPPMRKKVWTSAGRISNLSRNDIAELYVGLYHKADGKWTCVSNKVQVRGRNSAKTKLWEFEQSNIVLEK